MADITKLKEIMAALRDPENGCPWDIEQDFSTIAPYTIEEAYEVADAIQRNDMVDLKDELGDLLLQPIYLAQLAAEKNLFDFDDVVEEICNKMVRRHPHVFGDSKEKDIGMVKGVWEKIKQEEHLEKQAKKKAAGMIEHEERLLDKVPTNLPALRRAEKLTRRASSVGFDWSSPKDVVSKIEEELGELKETLCEDNIARQQEELGDLLFAITTLARHLRIDPEHALQKSNQKFIRRFAYVEERCAEDGIDPAAAGLEQLDGYWNEIRKADKGEPS